jgi:ABC-type multidrug transport system fused ATPase/permease subunit
MPLFDLFWAMLWFFLFFIWIWLLISVFSDVFRSRDLGGFAKAMWIIFMILLPYLGVFVYLIARGSGMAERNLQQAAEMEKVQRQYIQEVASTGSTADELAKLATLRDQGVLTEGEFQAQKAALIG